MNTAVIHHSADYDGIFCREVARKFLPSDTVFVGWDFGDKPLPFPSTGLVYVMDLPIERDIFSTPIDATRVVWIDHHTSSIKATKGEYRGYRIDGVAACRLAWQWFIGQGPNVLPLPDKEAFLKRNVVEPLSVRLAGEYDVWDHRDNDADILFQYGLDAQDELPWDRLLTFFCTSLVEKYLQDGRAAKRCIDKRAAQIVAHKGFDLRFEGLTFLALNTPAKGSLQFESAVQPHHDATLAFSWTGKTWVVSMYHDRTGDRDVDLSEIAVKYGGGGHRRACGFQAQWLPWLPC